MGGEAGGQELRVRLEVALRDCRVALSEYQSGLVDEAQLRRALKHHGMVEHGDEVWLLDLSAGHWCRYDGLSVDPVPAPLDAVQLSRLRGVIDRLADELVPGRQL
jgi:hypothetical protein